MKTRPDGRRDRAGVGGRVLACMATIATLAAVAPSARACDVCAIYVATEIRETQAGPWVGVAEQLGRFQTLQEEGEPIPGGGQQLTSSITQLIAGYDFLPELGVQVNVPLIVRNFRRPIDGTWQEGHENGLGDVSILAVYRPFFHMDGESTVRFSLLGGVETPTGSTDRIAEEVDEGGHTGARALSGRPRHEEEPPPGFPPNGIHGHDIALGSGSIDGLVGAQLFASWFKFFASADVQYAIRSTGDYDYRYANELTWNGGPGIFAILEHSYTLTVRANVGGEWKENDELDGEQTTDTAITAVYMGPALGFTWKNLLGASLALDLPVLQENSSIQLVPDFRLRGGLTWKI